MFGSNYFDSIENEILEDDSRLMEQLNYYNHICEDIDQLLENKFVYDKAQMLIQTNDAIMQSMHTQRSHSSRKSFEPERVSLSM